MACIYALLDPQTGTPRYIGKANSAAKRLASHLRDSRRRRTPVYDWIRSLSARGLSPDMLVLVDNCPDWIADERRLIEQARRDGLPLLNLADGGDQPDCPLVVRKANARRLNDARRDGTPIGAYWSMMRSAGLVLRSFKARPGREDLARELEESIAKLQAMSDEQKADAGIRWLEKFPYAC